MQMDPTQPDPKNSVPSLLGSSIGQYLIAEEIGRGGMGVVYRAVHQGVGQLAAVKVLSRELARDASYLRRFTNEARALSLVDHPGLVKIFDFGETPRGDAYILMEYLRGELLRSRLSRCKRLALPEVLRIGRQAVSALAEVHKNGIVHRDLKPSNMMLVADDEADGGERLKLLDFGIARFASGGADLTAPGSVLGTAMYMSPEQCVGESLVDGRSDVYSLGVVLYELIAGEPPFVGSSVEVLRMHLFQDARPLQEVTPEIPRELSMLIGQMLAKAPSLRPDLAHLTRTMRRDSGDASAAAATPERDAPWAVGGLHDEAALRAATTRPKTPRGNVNVLRDTNVAGPEIANLPAVGAQAPAADLAHAGPDETHGSAAPKERWRRLRALVGGTRVMLRATAGRPARWRRRLLVLGTLTLPVVLTVAASRLLTESDGASSGLPSAGNSATSGLVPAGNSATSGLAPASNSASSDPIPGGNDASPGMSADMNSSSATVRLTNMVRLQGGKFRMGSTLAEIDAECQRLGPACRRELLEREQPEREVIVSPFYIDAYETTNAEFAAWLEMLGPTLKVEKDPEHGILRYVYQLAENATAPDILLADLFPEYSGLVHKRGNHFAPRRGHARKPVSQVTWDAASLYCKARGKRLPTEAEWEFAARGTESRRYPWGDDPPRCGGVAFDRYGNGACSGLPSISRREQDVGTASQDRTPEGVWDLGGNVDEWVQDQFLLPYYAACGDCIDPVVEGPARPLVEDLRVRRGGAWAQSDTASRGATRGRWKRREMLAGLGFRCASR